MALLPPVPVPVTTPGPLLRLVDGLQARFFPDAMDDTTARWLACGILVLGAILLRRVITAIIFAPLRKAAPARPTS